jgi:hypothetical protein
MGQEKRKGERSKLTTLTFCRHSAQNSEISADFFMNSAPTFPIPSGAKHCVLDWIT